MYKGYVQFTFPVGLSPLDARVSQLLQGPPASLEGAARALITYSALRQGSHDLTCLERTGRPFRRSVSAYFFRDQRQLEGAQEEEGHMKGAGALTTREVSGVLIMGNNAPYILDSPNPAAFNCTCRM